VFDENRYFDVFVEYAKTSPEDILIQITIHKPRRRPCGIACAADVVVSQSMVLGRRR